MRSVGALYVHVPFCARKCAYCDFASAATCRHDPRMQTYVTELKNLLSRFDDVGLLEGCRTAYVGGGTPTFLGARLLAELVEAIRRSCPRLVELSFEANPDSLDDAVIETVHIAGATRVSVGVQSFEDVELHALGRVHDARCAHERVRAAVESGLDVSVDLMCAIPEQSDESWERSVCHALSLGVCHMSVYPLALEEGTPLARQFAQRDAPWNDEDVQAARMEQACALIEQAGLARYEVASYARPHKECKHNISYWTGVPYLGIGDGAASMLEHDQYEEARTVMDWLPRATDGAVRIRFNTLDHEVEFLDARQAWAEDLMLGMRLTRGIAKTRFASVATVVDQLVERGLVTCTEDRVVPTHDGWLLGNELFGALWDLA